MGMQGRDMHGTSLRCGYTKCWVSYLPILYPVSDYQLPVFQLAEVSPSQYLSFEESTLLHDRVLYMYNMLYMLYYTGYSYTINLRILPYSTIST
jgi:hypothetical protein